MLRPLSWIVSRRGVFLFFCLLTVLYPDAGIAVSTVLLLRGVTSNYFDIILCQLLKMLLLTLVISSCPPGVVSFLACISFDHCHLWVYISLKWPPRGSHRIRHSFFPLLQMSLLLLLLVLLAPINNNWQTWIYAVLGYPVILLRSPVFLSSALIGTLSVPPFSLPTILELFRLIVLQASALLENVCMAEV